MGFLLAIGLMHLLGLLKEGLVSSELCTEQGQQGSVHQTWSDDKDNNRLSNESINNIRHALWQQRQYLFKTCWFI